MQAFKDGKSLYVDIDQEAESNEKGRDENGLLRKLSISTLV